jgi:hypothetical protein
MATKASETITLPGYNGWANYPTWNAFLWLSNDRDTWNAFLDFGRTNPTVGDVRRYVYNYVTGTDGTPSPRADIRGWARHYDRSLHWALTMIDHESIREHLADAVADAI